jgi:hypothetical protein
VVKEPCFSEGATRCYEDAFAAALLTHPQAALTRRNSLRSCLRGLTHSSVLLAWGPYCISLTKNEEICFERGSNVHRIMAEESHSETTTEIRILVHFWLAQTSGIPWERLTPCPSGIQALADS